ncbi:MAG: ATP-binding protein [Rhodospirillales bacterium]|nr:ATP-binding protein [Rhodospirillales bacterium]
MSATETVKADPGEVERAGQEVPAESTRTSTRGGLVLPVILIISISLLTTCGLVWTSAQLLNKNAQATTRRAANSMIGAELAVLSNLVGTYARSGAVVQNVLVQQDTAWAAENLGRFLTESYEISASLVLAPDGRTLVAFLDGREVALDAFSYFGGTFDIVVERARNSTKDGLQPAVDFLKIDGTVHLVSIGMLPSEPFDLSRSGVEPQGMLVLTRALDRELLAEAGAAFSLESLSFFEETPPDSFYTLRLSSREGEVLGYLGWRNAWPGDEILWRLSPSLALALMAMTYVLYIFFRSTDLVLERQAYLVSSLRRERELRDLKTRFVSMVSHELRTPLSTIRSAADLLDRYDERMTSEERKRELGAIRTAVIRLTKVIEDVLAIGRSDSAAAEMKSTKVHLGRFCRDLWQETVEAMAAQHRLVLRGSAAEKYVHTDETFLRAALSNLLQNAIKYSPEGREVVVDIIGERADCVIRVTDLGPGIPSDEHELIFEAFHRGSGASSISGTGLGLAVAKAAAEKLGGRISVVVGTETGTGTGTTFELVLPGLLKARPIKRKRKSHDQDPHS